MKRVGRLIGLAGALYVGLAVWGLVRESRGELSCDCEPHCWCKKPGLRLFRWVFPIGHALPD